MEDPGGLQSMGLQRVGDDCAISFFFFFLSDFIFTVYKGLKSSVSGTGIQTAINIFLLFHSGILSASVSSKHLGPHFRVGAGKRMVEHRYLVNALC